MQKNRESDAEEDGEHFYSTGLETNFRLAENSPDDGKVESLGRTSGIDWMKLEPGELLEEESRELDLASFAIFFGRREAHF